MSRAQRQQRQPAYFCAICQEKIVSRSVKICIECSKEYDTSEHWALEAVRMQDEEYLRQKRIRNMEFPLYERY